MITEVKNGCSKVAIMTAVILALTASNPSAFAGTVNVKGSLSGSFVTANFTFDGSADALSITFAGTDNIGGPVTGQDLSEFHFTSSTCTAPDLSIGTGFVLAQASEVANYNQAQLYSAAPSGAGSGCLGSSGSFSVTETHSISGGTGKFVNATGSIIFKLTGQLLAAPVFGQFGAFQATETGSVTH